MAKENNNLTIPQNDQLYGDNNYVPDEWTQCEDKPTKLYQLDFYDGHNEITAPKSNYFIDEDTYNKYLKKDEDGNLIQDENGNNVFDVQQYCNDAQIAPLVKEKYDENENPVLDENGNQVLEASYKNHISCYEVPHEEVAMWEGDARANDQYGEGGAHQYFVPEDDLSKLKKDENFVSPSIPEEDRSVDPSEAQNAVNEGKEKNQEYRNDLEQTPIQEEAANADEIAAKNNNTNDDTLNNVAKENNLENTGNAQDNGLKNEQELEQ